MTLPIVMTSAGPEVTPPATLRARLVAIATALDPGLTTNLPGALIEDIASTDVGALTVTDSAFVDLVNSITPYGANLLILNQLGQIYGVQQGIGSNASVFVTFTGTIGFVISRGFTVSDGSHQFTVQTGGIVSDSGNSGPLFCLATQSGEYPIPADTVTTIVTSLPSGVVLTCNNETDGFPQTAEQTEEQYRAQVIQAGLASAQGYPNLLKTEILRVSGVQQRLVSVRQDGTKWQVVVGGGDPYQIAAAIFRSTFDILTLSESTLIITGITNANPGVATTNIAHGYTTGDTIVIAGATGMTGVNGSRTATVIDAYSFSFAVDTTSSGTYDADSASVTPNVRNQLVSVEDYPDTYNIPFIVPLKQTVTMTITWGTIAPNFVSDAAIAAVANPAVVSYINSIVAGNPINLLSVRSAFENAIQPILDQNLLSKIDIVVNVNGILAPPTSGTQIIPGDALSYFESTAAGIVIERG